MNKNNSDVIQETREYIIKLHKIIKSENTTLIQQLEQKTMNRIKNALILKIN